MTREEAIEILWRYDVNFEPHPPEEVMHAIDMAIEALSEQKTGEWVKSDILPNGWHCSLCDSPIMTDDISEMLFCPNCGARMVREDGE